mgnify:CR=1 FL=1
MKKIYLRPSTTEYALTTADGILTVGSIGIGEPSTEVADPDVECDTKGEATFESVWDKEW